MIRRLLNALGLSSKAPAPVPQDKPSTMNRLQRQSAMTRVDFDALRDRRRNDPPR